MTLLYRNRKEKEEIIWKKFSAICGRSVIMFFLGFVGFFEIVLKNLKAGGDFDRVHY